jgi:hypothetical protein
VGDHAQVSQVSQALEGVGRDVSQLAVLDAQSLELAEMLEASFKKLRLVLDRFCTANRQRNRACAWNHREIGLIVLRVDRPKVTIEQKLLFTGLLPAASL